ncbi:MAG: cytochrome c biogenesis protein ResB [Deltaproteobacteria bacterium]|nr:cytochrome c biogenesis protein ResB [Deltaproteobacteria bacterium]
MLAQRIRSAGQSAFRFFASVEFAIPALAAFAAAMIYGTVCESLYGTNYVRLAVYHSWWFYLIEGALLLSITLSVIARLPFQKRLIGFYVVHLGMLVIMAGAFVTSLVGIDGSIELGRGRASSSVRLAEETLLYIQRGQQQSQIEIPSSTSPVTMNQVVELGDGARLVLLKFLPFAKPEREWKNRQGAWVAQWRIKSKSKGFEQRVELSNLEDGQVPVKADIGLLYMEVVPKELFAALKEHLARRGSRFVLYHPKAGVLAALRDLKGPVTVKDGSVLSVRTDDKHVAITAYQLKTANGRLLFFPRFSPYPLTASLMPDRKSGYFLLDLDMIRAKNAIYISRADSGQVQIGFGKGKDWKFIGYEGAPIPLPWMQFELSLVGEKTDSVPETAFARATPSKEERENIKAVLVSLEKNGHGEKFWIDDRGSIELESSGLVVSAAIGPRETELPFAMTLDQFKMDRVPGTDKPASYESFVRVSDATETAHIYMNHPYKAHGYTFYQSSYYQDESGQYHSILSVNKDPGRPVKYIGSSILVLGLVLQFLIIHGHIKFSTSPDGAQVARARAAASQGAEV